MKKKVLTKIITVALSLVICLVPMLTVIASADAANVPIVDIHGLMASDIYVDPANPDSELAWPPSTDSILNTVKDVVPALVKLAVTKDWDSFGDTVVDSVNEMFKPIYCAADGSVDNTSGVRFTYPSAGSVKKNSVVKFKYDWRLDPIEVAAQLNDFVDYVLKCSGCNTVKICCHSLGGVVTNTYLTVYGDSKVSGVCFNSTAIFGQTYIGELMTGQIVLNSDALQYFLGYALDYNEYKTLLNEIIAIVKASGLMDLVVDFGNNLVDHLLEQASREVLAPMFGGWLSIWAMIRDGDIAEAQDFFFNELNKDVDYSALQTKINRYNTVVRPCKTQTLEKLNEKASVYVISRYGYCSIPITPSFDVVSDGVVDSASTSFGATIAPYGQTLSEEYLADADPKYISPDRTLDASTCLFPEQTWFIKDMQHANNPDSLDNMMYKMLRYNGQATVDTFEEYPRFCEYDSANDVISPYTEVEHAMTPGYKLGLMIREIITLIINLVQKIVNK